MSHWDLGVSANAARSVLVHRRLLAAILAILVPAALHAHDEKVSFSEVQVSGNLIIWKVDIGLAGLQKVMKLPAEPAELSEHQLLSVKEAVADYVRSRISVEVDGQALNPEILALEPIYEPFMLSGEPYIANVRQELRFRSGRDIKRLRLGIRLFAEVTPHHRSVLNLHWGSQTRQFVRVGSSQIEITRAKLDPSFWNIARDFLAWGVHHIFIGYDHIAFLLALLLGARSLRQMLFIVTSFTVAHSLTLLMAALDVIRVQQSITEALIAASIVYVSVENYFLREGRHRWVLTFLFGLIHGLGFSGVLREHLTDVPGIIIPVLSFNAGVEFGQIAILLVVFPLMLWLRRGTDEKAMEVRQHRLLWIGSAPILILGVGWLVERVFGLEFMPL